MNELFGQKVIFNNTQNPKILYLNEIDSFLIS